MIFSIVRRKLGRLIQKLGFIFLTTHEQVAEEEVFGSELDQIHQIGDLLNLGPVTIWMDSEE